VDSREKIEALLRARAASPPPPPLDATRAFLQSYVSDAESLDEVRDEVARAAAHNPVPVRATLDAIEAVIADPPRDGTLSYLVAVDANRQLPDPSDAGALAYLYRITRLLHEVLGSDAGDTARQP
jgi:hypothetical protein